MGNCSTEFLVIGVRTFTKARLLKAGAGLSFLYALIDGFRADFVRG